MPATALGLVTQGSDAGNAENLSTVIINGNFIKFFFSRFITFRKKCSFSNAMMLKFSAYVL